MNGRERILAALDHRPGDSLPLMPITMMFAADQIGIPYGKYAADYRVLVEAQLRTAEKFDVDHVSAISDPAREAADCGALIHRFDNQPPAIDETEALLADKSGLASLKAPDPLGGGRMHDRVKAIALFKEKVAGQKAIEGWIEGPWPPSADLRGINHLMMDFFDDPDFVKELFEFVLGMELAFARAQVDAGADLIGIGDAAASLVGPQIYQEFVQPYEQRMIAGVHAMGARVRLHICGNIRRSLADVGAAGADMVDIDSMVPLQEARAAMGPKAVLAGNLDPVKTVRNGTPESITATIAQCHREVGAGYIVGAGCEVPRGTPEANFRALKQYARSHR